MIWEISNSVFRLVVLALAVVSITQFRHMFLRIERIGLGLMGGCGFLTIGVVWERQNSPFDGWASSLFTFGTVLFLGGMLWRKSKHDRNNRRQLAISQSWMKGRGE